MCSSLASRWAHGANARDRARANSVPSATCTSPFTLSRVSTSASRFGNPSREEATRQRAVESSAPIPAPVTFAGPVKDSVPATSAKPSAWAMTSRSPSSAKTTLHCPTENSASAQADADASAAKAAVAILFMQALYQKARRRHEDDMSTSLNESNRPTSIISFAAATRGRSGCSRQTSSARTQSPP